MTTNRTLAPAARTRTAVALMFVLALAACGGAPDETVDGATDADDNSGDAAVDATPGTEFRVITHSAIFPQGRARLVAVRDGGAPWTIVPEVSLGEYAGRILSATIDLVVACHAMTPYDDAQVSFFHLTSEDPLQVEVLCYAPPPTVRFTGEVRPIGGLYTPGHLMVSAGTFDVDVRTGPGDVIATSSTNALIVHDLPFTAPTSLVLETDVNGSPLRPLDLSVTGALQGATVSRRSTVSTKNGTTMLPLTDALFPREQLVSGDQRRIYANAITPTTRRRVTFHNNQDGSFTGTFPPGLVAASYQRQADAANETFTWTGAFPDRRAIDFDASTSDETSSRYILAHISSRRMAMDGLGDNGTYATPDRRDIPGWEATWDLMPGGVRWSVAVRGSSSEAPYGARRADGDVTWESAMIGVPAAPE